MSEPRNTPGTGVVESVKGWIKQALGQASGRGRLEREGVEQQRKADAERDAVLHETEAARAKAEAEAHEARQEAAERPDEPGR